MVWGTVDRFTQYQNAERDFKMGEKGMSKRKQHSLTELSATTGSSIFVLTQ